MILCAGLGTRLKPVTDKIPKPLVPVLNVENVLHTIRLLERAGIKEIIVNLHYLPEHLESFLSTHKKIKANIFFSREETLLGTGGGVKKAESFFAGETFVLANCDFVTNLDVSRVIEEHVKKQSLATMLLYQNLKKQPKYSKVGVDAKGQLCSLPKLQTQTPTQSGIFTGIHVIEPECLKFLEEKPCGINDILYPALMKSSPSRVRGIFLNQGYWCDTGEVDTFLASTAELLKELPGDSFLRETLSFYAQSSETFPETAPPVLISDSCKIGPGTHLGPHVVVGKDCEIGEGASLENCVLLPSSKVPARSQVKHSLCFETLQIKNPSLTV